MPDEFHLDLMTRNYVDLLRTFLEAVAAFNENDIQKIERLLNDNVVLNRIYHQLDTHRKKGKKEVIKYLSEKLKSDHSQLIPMSPISLDSHTGTVSGPAMWRDPREADPRPVDYTFKFSFGEDGKWRVDNLLALPR